MRTTLLNTVLKRTALTGSGLALLASLIPVAPSPAGAATTPDTLAGATAAMDANVANLTTQATEIQQQTAEVTGTIGQLEAEYNALVPVISQKQQLLKESVKEAYVAGEPNSLEVVASNNTFSGVLSQQHYRGELSSKTQKAATDLEAAKNTVNEKLTESKQKRDGLVALQAQLDEKVATAQSQAEAKQALMEATQGKEEEYQKIAQAEQAENAEGIASMSENGASPSPSTSPNVASSPRPAARPSAPAMASASSVRGNVYPYGQCTWYVYSVTGRGQSGNAGTWRATSSTPAVGKIMISRPGQMGAGGAGHVSLVIGVNGNSVTVREMNWNGGPGVVGTHTQASTGMFY